MTGSPEAQRQAALLWQRSLAAHEAGRLDLAAAGLAEVVRLRPDWPEPAFRACLVALLRGDAEAGTHLQRVLTRFPDHAPGWEQLGRHLLGVGKAEAALACFRRADAGRATAAGSLLIGSALRALGRLTEARAAFAEASRRDPTAVRAHFLEALCAQESADWPAAAAGYRRVLAMEPDSVDAAVNLGTVLQATGDLDGARQAYRAALRRRPDSFGRISQALATGPKGELWLDLGRLRRSLGG